MPNYKHIIWDWNGTLLDDAWLCVEIINQTLRKRNLPLLTPKDYMEAFGFPVKDYYQRLGLDFSIEPFEVIAREYIDTYRIRRFDSSLRQNVKEILDNFNSAGYKQYILSAYEENSLIEMVKYHKIEHIFRSIVGCDDHYAHGKTSQGQELLKNLNVPPGEIIMVGDTTHDAEVAQQIGLDVVLFPTGHQSLMRLKECNGKVVNSFADVVEFILEK